VERLYLNIPEPKRLVFFPGAAHEDLLVYDPRRYIKAVTGFLSEFSLPQSTSQKISTVPPDCDAGHCQPDHQENEVEVVVE
jgi:hypothetical protein